jgi:hypothetical protein
LRICTGAARGCVVSPTKKAKRMKAGAGKGIEPGGEMDSEGTGETSRPMGP